MAIGTAKKIKICGKEIKLGDRLKVRYTRMETTLAVPTIIEGLVTELWDDGYPQARIDNGWCFHDNDEIIALESP